VCVALRWQGRLVFLAGNEALKPRLCATLVCAACLAAILTRSTGPSLRFVADPKMSVNVMCCMDTMADVQGEPMFFVAAENPNPLVK
jgi:hypothetical protein